MEPLKTRDTSQRELTEFSEYISCDFWLGLGIGIGVGLGIGIRSLELEIGNGDWDLGLRRGVGMVDCDWGLFVTFGFDFWL